MPEYVLSSTGKLISSGSAKLRTFSSDNARAVQADQVAGVDMYIQQGTGQALDDRLKGDDFIFCRGQPDAAASRIVGFVAERIDADQIAVGPGDGAGIRRGRRPVV